ncbi:uncharacterized protein LOC117186651 [Drosophila miranda]|uniref:uncharacterized protein LOC117186651 n=1 Tax=Drosophila miranda TaxID=7229 RepID=UPI00143F11C0|nr:uncharacterized protein LOC117186651 [Drosophila miranda]
MKILQLNIQSLSHNNNKQLLSMFLDKNAIDIAILSEIWVLNNADCSILDYNFFCRPREDDYGGVGIYVRKNIQFSILKIENDLEILGIKTLNLKSNFNIFSIYAPPSTTVSQFKSGTKKFFEFAASLDIPSIVGGDFNARSSIWGSPICDRKGRSIENSTREAGFICLNDEMELLTGKSSKQKLRTATTSQFYYQCKA